MTQYESHIGAPTHRHAHPPAAHPQNMRPPTGTHTHLQPILKNGAAHRLRRLQHTPQRQSAPRHQLPTPIPCQLCKHVCVYVCVCLCVCVFVCESVYIYTRVRMCLHG